MLKRRQLDRLQQGRLQSMSCPLKDQIPAQRVLRNTQFLQLVSVSYHYLAFAICSYTQTGSNEVD